MSTYRDDPRWQAAHETSLAETAPDELPINAMTRRIAAAHELYAVEREYEDGAR